MAVRVRVMLLLNPSSTLFFDFMNALAKLTSERFLDVEDVDKIMALTAINLSNSNTLSQNVALRNNLQENIGTLKPSLNGISVAQLISYKIKRCKAKINVAIAALILENGDFLKDTMYSPRKNDIIVSHIRTYDNSRWYRNRLHGNDEIDHDNVVSTITTLSITNQKYIVSCKTKKCSCICIT